MELFYELLQVALGKRDKLSYNPSAKECSILYEISQRQAVVGVAFHALNRLVSQGQKPASKILYDWIGQSEQIKVRNETLNHRCVELIKMVADAGFRSCILKGQGNAILYPEPLLRTPGDIDLWAEGSHEKVRNWVISKYPEVHDGNLHIEYPAFKDVTVEIHYKPGYSVVSKYDKRLQKWFERHAEEQFSHKVIIEGYEVCVPTAEFNAVQQMQHMMRHFVVEGIGMRHIIDYYYILKELHKNVFDENFEYLFKQLGILRFTSGIMWIEHAVLGIDEKCLVVPPSRRIGKIILNNVMAGGNFGHYRKENIVRQKSILTRGLIDACRMIKILPVQPSEVMCRLMKKIGNVRSIGMAMSLK